MRSPPDLAAWCLIILDAVSTVIWGEVKYLSLHVARRYLTERESSASRTLVAQRKIKHGPEMNSLSILHKKKLFSIVVSLRHSMLPMVVGERRAQKFFMIPVVQIVNRDRAPTNVRYFLRVYNVFLCLLSFWCFTLEWVLLAFRRYDYEYDLLYEVPMRGYRLERKTRGFGDATKSMTSVAFLKINSSSLQLDF